MWKGETVQASIQRVATLNTKCLEDFLKNIDTDMNPEAIDCINAFNIVLRHNPSNRLVFISIAVTVGRLWMAFDRIF